MTPELKRCYDFVVRWIADHNGVSPSYAEIKEGLGLGSKSQAHDQVMRLVERGYLTVGKNQHRSIQVVARRARRSAASSRLLSRCLDEGRSPTLPEMERALGRECAA